jgi:anti-sigma factor RsiW
MNDITCTTARELLLDAEPLELRAAGDSALAQHLRACDHCARAARAILAANDDLASALHTLAATPAAHTAAPKRMRRRILLAFAPLAAAAILLLVLWQRGPQPETLAPIVLPEPYVPTVPVVNVPATGTVAVMRASNPNITIVWNLGS